jgi:hypothetical protein
LVRGLERAVCDATLKFLQTVVSSTRNDPSSIARLTMGSFSGLLYKAKGK